MTFSVSEFQKTRKRPSRTCRPDPRASASGPGLALADADWTIRDIMSDPVDRAMVRAINELGQLLGKETIAKFVETINQAEELKKLGIQYIQGHACSRPQPLEEFVHTTAPRLVVVSS